jgi:cellobiose phosphorylase
MLNVSSCGSEYTFFMNQQSVNDSVLPWQIEVVQYDTGKIVCSQNSDNGTTTINTSGWKAGIYVVAAVVGNQVVETKKIVVK